MSILNFMSNIDDALIGKGTLRCPKCGSSDVKVDSAMEQYNEDLGKTYYTCCRCKEEFSN
jgi:DNA-directed RNA polymerase subunit RPC12/RpoP